MRAAAMMVVMVLLAVQASFTSAATIDISSTSTIISKPNCCYKCDGCYDTANQQRYFALTSVVSAAASSKLAICKPVTKCPVIDATKAVASNKSVTLKNYQQLTFNGAGVRSYLGASVVFPRFSALSLVNTGLILNSGQLVFKSPDTWLTAANGSIALIKSELKGSLRSFSTAYISLNQTLSSVLLTNTVVHIDYTRWTLRDSIFLSAWTAPATPSGPPYTGSYPFVASYSYIDIKSAVLRFENVTDAYFIYSTLQAVSCQVVLINSNVRFLDSVLDLQDMSFKLQNSTLVLNKATFKTDQYLSFTKGAIRGLPKLTYPFSSINKATFTATTPAGTIGLKSTTK